MISVTEEERTVGQWSWQCQDCGDGPGCTVNWVLIKARTLNKDSMQQKEVAGALQERKFWAQEAAGTPEVRVSCLPVSEKQQGSECGWGNGDGQRPGSRGQAHAALEATVRILAFALKDTGSHGRVWAEKS